MNSTNKIVTVPKHFKSNSILDFIKDCQFIFGLINKNKTGFLLDLSKVVQTNMIGVLLIYKFIEFTVKNNCFSTPMYVMDRPFQEAMEKYGFTKLILTYLADKEVAEKEFKNLKISVTDRFIIAPQALLRNDKYSSDLLNQKYLPQIEKYYSYKPKAVKMIFLCFSEILLNFWEHAVDDTQSIIVANGNKTNIEIACVDNGKGKKNKLDTLLSAIEKGVTSKELSNHMGYGLWIVDKIVGKSRGKLHLYSEGYYYQNEYGKINAGKCGFWKGTIVYISLPINTPVTLSDIEEPNKFSKIKINWNE